MLGDKKLNLILAVLTILFAAVSVVSINKVFLTETTSHMTMDEDDSDRNENSTPRSFVLPATPAVA